MCLHSTVSRLGICLTLLHFLCIMFRFPRCCTALCYMPAGLQKLLDSKDNHIFRGLATLAAYGCTYKDAVAAGKDVMQRVGSKGPAADLTRVLVARLTPNLVPPEVLHAAMEEAEQSEDGGWVIVCAGAIALLFEDALFDQCQ